MCQDTTNLRMHQLRSGSTAWPWRNWRPSGCRRIYSGSALPPPQGGLYPSFPRWDWGGCQQDPNTYIPSEEVRLEPVVEPLVPLQGGGTASTQNQLVTCVTHMIDGSCALLHQVQSGLFPHAWSTKLSGSNRGSNTSMVLLGVMVHFPLFVQHFGSRYLVA